MVCFKKNKFLKVFARKNLLKKQLFNTQLLFNLSGIIPIILKQEKKMTNKF